MLPTTTLDKCYERKKMRFYLYISYFQQSLKLLSKMSDQDISNDSSNRSEDVSETRDMNQSLPLRSILPNEFMKGNFIIIAL